MRDSKTRREKKTPPIAHIDLIIAEKSSSSHNEICIGYCFTKSDTMSNKDEEGQLASQSALLKILNEFPNENLVQAFGYGSGVFSQTIDEKHEGMLDMILVVDDASEFHKRNLEKHSDHYAPWLRYSGSEMVDRMQRRFLFKDAQVLFHVVDTPVKMKYGIVHQDDLLRDLTQWESLYLAGRLHKPTLPITRNPPDELIDAQNRNLKSAIAAALLLLPPAQGDESDTIDWPTFYSQVASLSYAGDFRMKVGGEDPKKISKLVEAPGQMKRFQSMYQPILKNLEGNGILSQSSSSLSWNGRDLSARKHLVHLLPPNINHDKDIDNLANILANIVAPAARNQSLKGVFTLGFRKSIKYATAKLSKGLLRKKS